MTRFPNDLDDLAVAARILADEGHEDLTLGHVALRDPEGRGFWMKRAGIALGEVQGSDDFLLVDWDGRLLAGEGRRHGEWPLHGEAFLARPDLKVSLHSHPHFATLLTGDATELVRFTQDGLRLGAGPLPSFDLTADLVTTRDAGKAAADALGLAHVLMMRNHGICLYDETVPRMVLRAVFLERAARAFIRARAAGLTPAAPPSGDAARVISSLDTEGFVADNWAHLKRRLSRGEG